MGGWPSGWARGWVDGGACGNKPGHARLECPARPAGCPADPAGGNQAGGQSTEQLVGMLTAEGPKALTVEYVKVFGKRWVLS